MDCFQEPMTHIKEWTWAYRCMNCAVPSLSLILRVRALCSPCLFMPNCASFLQEWLVAAQCDNVANARMGANNNTSPYSRALQPIYRYKLFTLLSPKGIVGASLLLSGREPVPSELCLFETMATYPDIGDDRMKLVRAYLGAEGTKAESVSKLAPLFQKGANDEDKAKALNELMIMYIKKGIMFDELCKYANILDPENQFTHTIIELLIGLHSGASLSAKGTFGDMCDSMIGHITATTKGAFGTTSTPTHANIKGMILALYIGTVLTPTTPTIPTAPTTPTDPSDPTDPTDPADEKQPITTERAIIMAIKCGYNDIVTVMKVAHDRAVRAHAELFWYILTSRMRDIEKAYSRIRSHSH